jgi:hypothetical protein
VIQEAAAFELEVRGVLARGEFHFAQDANVGGARVDFVVYRDDVPLAALEVSAPSNAYAAEKLLIKRRFAQDYAKGLSGLPVLIVIPDRLRDRAHGDIVPLGGLLERLRSLIPKLAHAQAQALIQPAAANTLFASMPFSDEYVDTLRAIRYAGKKIGLVTVRIDHDYEATDVVEKIKAGIRAAKLVVVDVSEARPSVLHEYGFAEAVPGKRIIAISSTALADLPFNVRNNTTLAYVRGNYIPMRRRLLTACRDAAADGFAPAPR